MHCYLLPLAAMLFLSPGLIAQPSDPIRAKLDDAKQKHIAAQAKQREDIREALDKKEATARASGDKKAVDALLEQRKAFETDGTIPVALPAAIRTDAAKTHRALLAAFDEAIKAYVRTKNDKEAEMIEQEKADFLKGTSGGAEGKAELARRLEGTEWSWEAKSTLKFAAGGAVVQSEWTKAGLATKWVVVDRRTVVLVITKGRATDRVAVLTFNEDLTEFGGIGFEGEFGASRKRK